MDVAAFCADGLGICVVEVALFGVVVEVVFGFGETIEVGPFQYQKATSAIIKILITVRVVRFLFILFQCAQYKQFYAVYQKIPMSDS